MRCEEAEKLAKYAAIAHVKTHGLNERREGTTIDIGKCVNLLRKQGFDGYYSIGFAGKGDQVEVVQRTVAELGKYL